MRVSSVSDYLNRKYSNTDRVLLINPPVVEARYQWSRWNQPLDLLKLGSYLKAEFECEVRLFDFMLPSGGKVNRLIYKPESSAVVGDHSLPIWRWGQKEEDFTTWFDRLLLRWRPTDIWLTSLTTYWWKGVRDTVISIKNCYCDANVVLYGQYPMLETEHALQNSLADVLLTDKLELKDYSADFSLYEKAKPEFCALDVRARNWHEEALEKFREGLTDFVFFNDPLIGEAEEFLLRGLGILKEQVEKSASKKKLRFHGICGLYPGDFSDALAKGFKEAGFSQLHFEYQTNGEELNLDAYIKAKESYERAEFNLDPDHISGFVNIGMPNDNLERIIRHALNLLEIFGSIIFKPYAPTPRAALYEEYRDFLRTEKIERLSPHFFPFSRINHISLKDYEELYILAAALNKKVRNRSFNYFPGTLAYEMIKTSLNREVWRLNDEKSAAHKSACL